LPFLFFPFSSFFLSLLFFILRLSPKEKKETKGKRRKRRKKGEKTRQAREDTICCLRLGTQARYGHIVLPLLILLYNPPLTYSQGYRRSDRNMLMGGYYWRITRDYNKKREA